MKISDVIPVKNEGQHIRQCISGWLSQTLPVHEIVVIDSGSTDNTLSILSEFSLVRIMHIDGGRFNHGTTRNLAVAETTGDLVMMTVGDARPVDDGVLERLAACFTSDAVAGACGSQVVPHDADKNPIEWFRPRSQPATCHHSFQSPGEYDALAPEEMHRVTSWDDVVAMYRGDILRDEIPFEEILYGEDVRWAQQAYRAGYTLAFCPAARVFHYHLEDAEVTFKRAITMYYLRYRMFGVEPAAPPVVRPILSALKVLIKEKGLSVKQRLAWMQHNLANRLALRSAYRRFHAAMQAGQEQIEQLHQEFTGRQFKVSR